MSHLSCRDAQSELADKGEEAEAETDGTTARLAAWEALGVSIRLPAWRAGEDMVPHISTPGAAAAIEVEQTQKDPEAMR